MSKVVKGTVMGGAQDEPQWSSGLCDCTGEWNSCISVWFCMPVTVAQLTTKLVKGSKNTCILLAVLLFVCAGYSQTVQSTTPVTLDQSSLALSAGDMDVGYADEEVATAQAAVAAYVLNSYIARGLSSLFFALSCLAVCQVRAAIRKRDGIKETNCAGCEDCMCAWFCNPCTQCMIFRHEASPNAYAFCSADGKPEGMALV